MPGRSGHAGGTRIFVRAHGRNDEDMEPMACRSTSCRHCQCEQVALTHCHRMHILRCVLNISRPSRCFRRSLHAARRRSLTAVHPYLQLAAATSKREQRDGQPSAREYSLHGECWLPACGTAGCALSTSWPQASTMVSSDAQSAHVYL